jgi:hypothetical protein
MASTCFGKSVGQPREVRDRILGQQQARREFHREDFGTLPVFVDPPAPLRARRPVR